MVSKRAPRKAYELRSELYRGLVLEAAEKEFAEQGFADARVRRIADEVGLPNGTVYNLFENRKACTRPCSRRVSDSLCNFIGQLLRCVGKYVPPATGVSSPSLWGSEAHVAALFAGRARVIACQRKMFNFHYHSAEHFVDVFRRFYGPSHKAFNALDARGQEALTADMTALMAQHNRVGSTALAVPSEYLEVVLETFSGTVGSG